jgi:hypothetical protein
MSVVTLLGVRVLNNPAKFTDKYEFEITFECLEALEKGTPLLRWQTLNQGVRGLLNIHRSRVEADLRRFSHFVSLPSKRLT